MLLPSVFAGALEEAIEQFLALDPHSRDYLDPLAGKVIELRLMPFDYRLYLCPARCGVQLFTRISGEPDAVLTGSLLSFASMGARDSSSPDLNGGGITVDGDVETARHLQSMLTRLNIDWERWLARYTGEAAAGRLVRMLRAGHAWRKELFENLRLDLAEYLQEETRDLPAPAEVDLFYREVDALHSAYERLEARMARLKDATAASVEPTD